MYKANLPALQRRITLAILAASLCGCSTSDRTIHLADVDISPDSPVPFAKDSMPVAASPDGNRIAYLSASGPGHGKITVIDTSDQRVLAATNCQINKTHPIMFGPDSKTVDIDAGDGYIAWDFQTGAQTKLSSSAPLADGVDLEMLMLNWNDDRSILMEPLDQKGRLALIRTSAGPEFHTGHQDQFGFDQYGNAWFGHSHHWTKINKSGHASQHSGRPKSLVYDQTRDRGSMHLCETRSDAHFKGATAHLTTIWLTDDRAVPYPKDPPGTITLAQSYRAALVFAGPDVFTYGFVPHKNLIYVITQTGNYLVPLKYQPGA